MQTTTLCIRSFYYRKTNTMKREKVYKVYMHTNLINNKKYIGITSRKLNQRWQNGHGYKHNKFFYRAIQKYGWDNFKHEVLLCNLTQEQAEMFEIELIKYYKSNNHEFGYNIQKGGNLGNTDLTMSAETRKKMSLCRKNKKMNEITKQKISIANQGKVLSPVTRQKISQAKKGKYTQENNHFYNKHHTLQTKQLLSDLAKERFKNPQNHPMFNKHLSEKSKQIISQKNKQRYAQDKDYRPNSKKCICLETKEIFNTLTDASKKYNTTIMSISNVCNGYQQTVNDLHFLFLENYNPNIDYNLTYANNKPKCIICIETKEIFKTIKECAIKMNLNASKIGAVCRHNRKSTGGYHFEYFNTKKEGDV